MRPGYYCEVLLLHQQKYAWKDAGASAQAEIRYCTGMESYIRLHTYSRRSILLTNGIAWLYRTV
eukprot:scaffold227592_cov36-Attheya_sp.AAC.4